MKVRLRRPVFATVTIDEIAQTHAVGDATGTTEVTATTRPRSGALAVPLDHDAMPVLIAEQVGAPRQLRVGSATTTVYPPDWIVTGPEGESLPCSHDLFERLFEACSA